MITRKLKCRNILEYNAIIYKAELLYQVNKKSKTDSVVKMNQITKVAKKNPTKQPPHQKKT